MKSHPFKIIALGSGITIVLIWLYMGIAGTIGAVLESGESIDWKEFTDLGHTRGLLILFSYFVFMVLGWFKTFWGAALLITTALVNWFFFYNKIHFDIWLLMDFPFLVIGILLLGFEGYQRWITRSPQ